MFQPFLTEKIFFDPSPQKKQAKNAKKQKKCPFFDTKTVKNQL